MHMWTGTRGATNRGSPCSGSRRHGHGSTGTGTGRSRCDQSRDAPGKRMQMSILDFPPITPSAHPIVWVLGGKARGIEGRLPCCLYAHGIIGMRRDGMGWDGMGHAHYAADALIQRTVPRQAADGLSARVHHAACDGSPQPYWQWHGHRLAHI